MGVCCSNTTKKHERQAVESRGKVYTANANSSVANDKPDNELRDNSILAVLRAGDARSVQRAIDNGEVDLNEFVFDAGTTNLLLFAVQNTRNPAVIRTILESHANVNAKHKITGDTALNMTAVDLKVEFVKVILEFNPDIYLKNQKGQDVFAYIQENLTHRKERSKSVWTAEEKTNHGKVIDMLKEYKLKADSTHRLDDDEKKRMKMDDSGRFTRDQM